MLPIWPLQAFESETLVFALGTPVLILVLVPFAFLSLWLPSWSYPGDPIHSEFGLEGCELIDLSRGQGTWLLRSVGGGC